MQYAGTNHRVRQRTENSGFGGMTDYGTHIYFFEKIPDSFLCGTEYDADRADCRATAALDHLQNH
ncbi:hypothetical protein D3C73_1501030 [compost metagenome]